MALSEKRRRFVETYMATGNATEAARVAGYSHPEKQGSRLLKNVEVRRALQERAAADPAVKTREEVTRWWSRMMDEADDERNRVKCSELLGKALGLFVQKVEHDFPNGVPIEVSAKESAEVRRLLENPDSAEHLLKALEVAQGGSS